MKLLLDGTGLSRGGMGLKLSGMVLQFHGFSISADLLLGYRAVAMRFAAMGSMKVLVPVFGSGPAFHECR
jgi:hypothetical protein